MTSEPDAWSGHERNRSLDALRGLAASLVLIVHASETYAPIAQKFGHSVWFFDASLAIDIGRTGVVLFFLISGFTVSNSLRQTDDGIGGFFIRRFFRLYPLFWFSILLALVFFRPPEAYRFSTIAANLTMLPEPLGRAQMLGIYWTLETEVISYAIAALLFVCGLFNSARFLAATCFLLVLVFAMMMFELLPAARLLQWQMLPHNLALILWGSLFHLTYTRQQASGQGHQGGRHMQQGLTFLIAALVLSPSMYSLIQYAMHAKPENLRWGVAYPSAVALFLLTFFWVRRVPRMFAWIGEISYSTYLLHPFVIALLISIMQENNFAVEWINVPMFAAISLVTTTALAGLSFRVIEKPAIRLGKSLEARYRLKLARAGLKSPPQTS